MFFKLPNLTQFHLLRSFCPHITSNDLEIYFLYYFSIYVILLYFLHIYMIKERVNFSGQNFASFLNPAESFRREFRIFNFSFLESTCLLFIFLDKFDLSKSCELKMISLKNECNILRRLSQTVILLHKGSYFSEPRILIPEIPNRNF